MKNKFPFLCALGVALCSFSALVFTTGCELNVNADQAGGGTTPPPAVTTNTPPPGSTNQPPSTNYIPPVGTYDQLDVSHAVLLGPHKGLSHRTAPTRNLYKADKSGANVHLSFDTLHWPSTGSSKKVDGGVYIFWMSGAQVLGGFFDWHGVGQTSKTLGNIPAGYLDGQQPPAGATIWFCIVNLANTERTFVTQSNTKW